MLRILAISIIILSPTNKVYAAPNVVVSIKPLHSLASAVMHGVNEPVLLIPGTMTPHTFRITPSMAKTIEQADLTVWVGEQLESKLSRPLASLAKTNKILTLSKQKEINMLPNRQAGVWLIEPHSHNHNMDPHIWLDPDNALKILQLLCKQLITIDPERAQLYKQNTAEMIAKITELDQLLQKKLIDRTKNSYLVLHDSLQYFEKRYALTSAGAMTIDPERKPSAKRLRALRNLINDKKIQCVFSEPQFGSQLVKVLTENTTVAVITIDPLGADIPSGSDAYIKIMKNLANSISSCLPT